MVTDEKATENPLWESALKVKEESEAQRRFEALWAKECLPKVRGFLRSRGFRDDDLEDLQQETSLRVWQALCRPSASGDGIDNIPAYAKRVAFSVTAEHLSGRLRRQPKKRELLHRVLEALSNDRVFAVWRERGEKWCGLVRWRGEPTSNSTRLDEFQAGQYEAFVRGSLGNRTAQEFVGKEMERLPLLLAHLFTWIEMPLPVNDLVLHLMQLLNLVDMRFESLDDTRGQEPAAMTDAQLLADPFTREYLRQYGVFLCKSDLTRCERGSTALVLTRDSLVAWLQISITALAETLGYAPGVPEQFQTFRRTIWQRLPRMDGEPPLTDQEIADLLEIAATPKTSARQMVVNCRSVTRNRKWPLWLKKLGWGE